MRIMSLTAENIKRIVAVEIKPDGNLVQITGQNGNGKTSVLDAILWALRGLSSVQGFPIRQGENQARIRLDLGEIIVTRKFKLGEKGQTTTSLEVTSDKGARFPSPQSMIDNLLGALSFDPLAFARMSAKEQYESLRKFVPGVDFAAIEAAQKSDYDKRTEVNRRAKEARSAAAAIVVSEGPMVPVDDKAMVDALAAAADTNAKIEARKSKRAEVAGFVERDRAEAVRISEDARVRAEGIVVDAKDSLLRAQKSLEEVQARAVAIVNEAATKSADLRKTADANEAKIKAAPALPPIVDVSELRAKIDSARLSNVDVIKRQDRADRLSEADKLDKEAGAISDGMDARAEEKAKAIRSAKLPVDGLGFGVDRNGQNVVTMKGLPFDQASDAEQLRISIAIAGAMNPKLRVIRVRDGSLLDTDSLNMVEEWACKNDYQVWVERVEGSGVVGFVIEDGRVVPTDELEKRKAGGTTGKATGQATVKASNTATAKTAVPKDDLF